MDNKKKVAYAILKYAFNVSIAHEIHISRDAYVLDTNSR